MSATIADDMCPRAPSADLVRVWIAWPTGDCLMTAVLHPGKRVVGANLFVARASGVPWAKVRGMTVGSGQLVHATADGKLWRVNFNGQPTGAITRSAADASKRRTWASTGMFSYQ